MTNITAEARTILTDMVRASGYNQTAATGTTFTAGIVVTDELLDNGWAVRLGGSFVRLTPAGYNLGRQLLS